MYTCMDLEVFGAFVFSNSNLYKNINFDLLIIILYVCVCLCVCTHTCMNLEEFSCVHACMHSLHSKLGVKSITPEKLRIKTILKDLCHYE